jgi:hypothetical protein
MDDPSYASRQNSIEAKETADTFWEDILKDQIQDTNHGSGETARWLISTVILLQGFYLSGLVQLKSGLWSDLGSPKTFWLIPLAVAPCIFWTISIFLSLRILGTYRPLIDLSNPEKLENDKKKIAKIYFAACKERSTLLNSAVGTIICGFIAAIIGVYLYMIWTQY